MALTAVGIGVAALISLRAFITGQQDVFLNGLVKGQLGALQVHRRGYVDTLERLPLGNAIVDGAALREKMTAVPGVTAVAGRIVFGGLLAAPSLDDGSDGPSATAMVTAIDPVAERLVCPQRFAWTGVGEVFHAAEARELWLNNELAQSLGLSLSTAPDEARWPAMLAADADGALNGEALALTATQLSALPGDRKVAYVPLGVAQRLLRMDGRVTEYAVAVAALSEVPRIQRDLERALGPEFEVHRWNELVPFMDGLIANMDLTLAITTGLLLVVALLGVLNAMLTNVLERRQEIGAQLAIGMRRRSVVRLFLIEGLAVGVLGGALGVTVGVTLVAWLGARGITIPIPGSDVPAVVIPRLQAVVAVLAFVIAAAGSTLATLWPAIRASRLSPMEALTSR